MSPGTLRFYQFKLRIFVTWCEGQSLTRLDEVTANDLRRFLAWLEETGHNAGGRHAVYRSVRALLRWWEYEVEPEGWQDPTRKVKAPKMPSEPLQPVEIADVHKLADVCERGTFYGDRDRTIFLTLLDSGVRAQELLSLDVSDLDMRDGSLLVRQGKGRKPRPVFVGKQARRALRQWLKYKGGEAGALFMTHEGERLTYWGLRQIIRRRSEQACIPEPSAHDFRRAACLGWLQAGVDVVTISRLLGHSTVALVARYAKQTKANLQENFVSLADRER
jgi:site-specific recombinase XerD